MRLPHLTLPLLAVLAVPTSALAIEGLTEANFEMELRLPDDNDGLDEDSEFQLNAATDLYTDEYFDIAHCECGSRFQIQYRTVGISGLPSEPVEVWLGTGCNSSDTAQRSLDCREQDSLGDISALSSGSVQTYRMYELLGESPVVDGSSVCRAGDGTKRTVWALVDEGGDLQYEHAFIQEIDMDLKAPPAPENVTTVGSEEAIQIKWDLPASSEDIADYQVLCAKVDDGTPVKDDPKDAQYQTASSLCPGSGLPGPDITDLRTGVEPMLDADGGVVPSDIPQGLLDLDPSYICASESGGTRSFIRVEDLENDTAYHLVLVVIDQAGNPTALLLNPTTPASVTDFWEKYKEDGGSAEGGCATSSTSLGMGVLCVLALLWFARKRRGTPVTLALLLSATSASAQTSWDELADNSDVSAQVEEVDRVLWNIGLKFGPYTPKIDSEFTGQGPYESTFGDGFHVMSHVEVDRYFLYKHGQLGVTASIGYMAANGEPFSTENGMTTEERSAGDNTSFRLVPMSLGVVYRATQLDRQLRVPLVPYGRLALSYYSWRITAPSGDTAQVGMDEGSGASLGWQGSIGIAFRAERIDKDAELALRNELGIAHAGFFAELSLAQVDGFGSDSKLNVGDTTWYGGVNFEF